MPKTHRLIRRVAAAAVLLASLAACGGDDPDADEAGSDNGTSQESDEGASDAAFPVTIEHKYGETTIEQAPERVVSVGLVEQDALLALGVVPVGVTKWFGEAPGAIFPWAEEALGDAELPEVLSDVDGIQVEKVAALAPDLIIGLYSGMTKAEYELLSQIAPVVATSEEVNYTQAWDDSTEVIGQAIGKPAEAEALIDDVESQLEAAVAEHPEFEDATAAVVTPYEGLYVYGESDPRGQMLDELGFEFPDTLEDPDATEFGWSLSAERTSDLADLDAVVWLDYDNAESGMSEIFEGTKAFKEGRFFSVSDEDGAYYVAHSMVTPLSIPYVLDRYLPQLAAALDGDPSTEPPAPSE